jgi:hypothetical protein
MILHSEVAVIKMTSLIEREIGTEKETETVIENGTEIVIENVNGTETETETETETVTVIVSGTEIEIEIETGEETVGTKTEVI